MTLEQKNEAVKFLKDGPLEGLSQEALDRVFIELNNGQALENKKYWYAKVVEWWPRGKSYDYATLKQTVSRLLTTHSYKARSGGKSDEYPLHVIQDKGKLDDIIPNISPEEERFVQEKFKAAGYDEATITREAKDKFYLEQILMLPSKAGGK